MRASVHEITRFIDNAYDDLLGGSNSTWHIELNDCLELDVGWSGGFDERDTINGDGYAICGKICVNDDLPDYEWATMPYYEDGDVYDTETELWVSGNGYKSNINEFAEYVYNCVDDIMGLWKRGEIIIPGCDNYDDEYTESKSIRESRPSRATTYELLCPEQVENDIESIIGFAECMQNTYSMWVDGFLTSTEMCESFLRYTKDIKRICDYINRGCKKN